MPLARQLDVDAARGIAIILVVIGHVVARDNPPGNEWYAVLKEVIYRFHMPLFMVLAGISFALSLPAFANWRSIAEYSRRKLGRLIVPYLFFGLLILGGKLLASRFVHVDNIPQGSADDVLALIVHPSTSAAGFLWFIYVLGLYFVALPGLLQLSSRRPIALFAASLAAQAFTWPSAFLLDQTIAYLPYFSGGMLLWMCRDRWARMSPVATACWVLLFGIALASAMPLGLSKWFVGALSVPAVLGMAQWIPSAVQQRLAWLGQLSLSIYLMNTLMIGIVKALMLKVMPWDGTNFLVYFPLLLLAGVALPVLVKQFIGRRAPAVDRYI